MKNFDINSQLKNGPGERSIGAILIDAGRLSAIDAEKVLREQKLHNLRFGEAALTMGLVTQDDIEYALANQFDYPYLAKGDLSVSEEVIAAFNPQSSVVEELRALRTQLMLRWFDTGINHKSLAVVSDAKSDGRSFIVANLGVVFSQLGERTLIIDADLRTPRQHQLFKIPNSVGLSTVLAGRIPAVDAVIKIDKLLGLSVLPAGATPPNPQELLGRDAFSSMLREFSDSYDVIIIDTTAAKVGADALTTSSRAGAALLVASMNRTAVAELKNLATNLQNTNIKIVGMMLNDF